MDAVQTVTIVLRSKASTALKEEDEQDCVGVVCAAPVLILCSFYAHFVQLLCSFCAAPVLIFCSSCAHFAPHTARRGAIYVVRHT